MSICIYSDFMITKKQTWQQSNVWYQVITRGRFPTKVIAFVRIRFSKDRTEFSISDFFCSDMYHPCDLIRNCQFWYDCYNVVHTSASAQIVIFLGCRVCVLCASFNMHLQQPSFFACFSTGLVCHEFSCFARICNCFVSLLILQHSGASNLQLLEKHFPE